MIAEKRGRGRPKKNLKDRSRSKTKVNALPGIQSLKGRHKESAANIGKCNNMTTVNVGGSSGDGESRRDHECKDNCRRCNKISKTIVILLALLALFFGYNHIVNFFSTPLSWIGSFLVIVLSLVTKYIRRRKTQELKSIEESKEKPTVNFLDTILGGIMTVLKVFEYFFKYVK